MIRFNRKLAVVMGVLLAGGIAALARPVWVPSYKEMTEKSDLVVIATPIARKELPLHTVMPGVLRGNDQIPAIQVETTFRAEVVLRGKLPADQDQFTLLHLIEANPPTGLMSFNPQALVDFSPNSGDEYLMFLKRDKDGRYLAMNGQTDPACSIRGLVSADVFPTTRPSTQP